MTFSFTTRPVIDHFRGGGGGRQDMALPPSLAAGEFFDVGVCSCSLRPPSLSAVPLPLFKAGRTDLGYRVLGG